MYENNFFIGSNNKTKKLETTKIKKVVGDRFKAFSFSYQKGYYKGVEEKSLKVTIINDKPLKKSVVMELINRLKTTLKQEQILYSVVKLTTLKFI